MPESDIQAKRLRPHDLGALDVRHDPRIAWASAARASSTHGGGYEASSACGPPTRFPRGGDFQGTWLARRDDDAPWLEVELPAVDAAVAIIVCETCGPGAVLSIRDVERDVVLWERPPEVLRDHRKVRILHVPQRPGAPPPRKLRLDVAPYSFGEERHQIDAVGVLLAPLTALIAAPPVPTHRRYAPSEVTTLRLRDDERFLWAKKASASSQYSSSYSAARAVGRPNVFPRGGDLENTWLSANDDRSAWIELEFPAHERAFGFVALETCGAGAIWRATDEQGRTLWQAVPEKMPRREARLLHVPLEDGLPSPKLRLWVSPDESDYREIDAVALLSAPFEELSRPPPPPPPPPPEPIPGAPPDGFTMLEGTLLGASAERPLVHAKLGAARKPGRAVNRAGELRLRLDSGHEVALEIDGTCLYGGSLHRVHGTWEEVCARAPELAAPFAGSSVDPDERVLLEARSITDEVRVYVAGVPGARRAHGFRDSARAVPDTLRAAAIATTPLEHTSFVASGTDDFERAARPPRSEGKRAHPLRRWTAGVAIAAGACIAITLLGVVAITTEIGGGAAIAVAIGVTGLLASSASTFALELLGRLHGVPAFVRGETLKDHRPPFGGPGWTILGSSFVIVPAAGVIGVVSFEATEPLWAAVRLALFAGALYALARLFAWQWTAAPSLVGALRVLLAPEGRALGALVRLEGTLADGQRHARTETYSSHSEHLGVEYVKDDRGEMVARDRWRHWSERNVGIRGTPGVRIALRDGTLVRTTNRFRSTDVGLAPVPPRGVEYARFESAHVEGDEATIVGRVESGGDEIAVAATHVVLGTMAELRRRIAVQVLALAALLALVAMGGLASLI